MSEDECMKMIR